MTNQNIAVVFPGQGSQSVGMLAELAKEHPLVQETFSIASDALGYDLWQLTQAGPLEKLDQTIYTQPALLTAAYAAWRVLNDQQQMNPSMLAGHSLGEYTALVCAKALDFTDGVRLVAARGRFMQEAVQPGVGAMAAIIGLEDAAVLRICKEVITGTDEILSPANYNSIGQIVVAGHQEAVLRDIKVAKAEGAKMAVIIPVSVPSHCALMNAAAERLAEVLVSVKFSSPILPVISNVDVKPYDTTDSIRDGLVRQLSMPVRWVETIQLFKRQGVTDIIECGPGKILTGLNKRIDKSLNLRTISDNVLL